jgi:hypothetical protein
MVDRRRRMTEEIEARRARPGPALATAPGADDHKFLWSAPEEQVRNSIAVIRLELRYIEEGLQAVEAALGSKAPPSVKSVLGPNQSAGPSAGRRRRGPA